MRDIELMEHARQHPSGLAMNLYRPIEAAPGAFRFKVFRAGEPIALSLSLPMLEHLGVRVDEERPYLIEPDAGAPAWIHDFGLEIAADPDGRPLDVEIERVKPLFEDAFARAWNGEIENDDFNRLVLRAGLAARDVTILRAYAQVPAAGGLDLQQCLYRARADQQSEYRRAAGGAVRGALRPCRRPRRVTRRAPSACWPRSRPRWTRCPTSTRTASCACS